jgi:hypothetical protein
MDRASCLPKAGGLFVSIVLTALAVAIAGWIAVDISQDYYEVAPFHFDSVSYRFNAVRASEVLQSEGGLAACVHAFNIKDGLDLTLRILLAPGSLVTTYGHLSVLLPFMFLFLWLLFLFVHRATRSYAWGGVALVSVFTFPIVYSPYMGIADYWKDNIAVWILGAALVSWVLSQGLQKRAWSFVSGVLCGLLVAQRASLAVYAAVLMLPLVGWAFYRQVCRNGIKHAGKRLALFLVPIIILGGSVAAFQLRDLYRFYFVKGYGYLTRARIVTSLCLMLKDRFGVTQTVFMFICLVCALSISDLKSQLRSIAIGLWYVLGFPLILIAMRTDYHAFTRPLTVFLIVLLATVIPTRVSKIVDRLRLKRALPLGLLVLLLGLSYRQYGESVRDARERAATFAGWRSLWEEVSSKVVRQPEPRRLSILFRESETEYYNHVLFSNQFPAHVWGDFELVGFLWVHDSYYGFSFPELSFEQMVARNIEEIEEIDGALALAFPSADAIYDSTAFGWDSKDVAVPFAVAMHEHVINSPHWQPLDSVNSPDGRLCLYRYSTVAGPPELSQ